MQNRILEIQEFLDSGKSGVPIIDVRTPAEFKAGHIPGAINVPLFDNEERKEIGTIYKHDGRNPAILQGLNLIGPRMNFLATEILSQITNNEVLIHCWRGGMRSSSVAWLINLLKIKTSTLHKGYKNFRRFVLDTFAMPYQLVVLGGKTGSAKTQILAELNKQGEQVIDLEGLAEHKGSAFGEIDKPQTTTQEMFENNLALKLRELNPEKTVWIEDESRTIGQISVPLPLWEAMRRAKVIFLEIPQSERISFLAGEYAGSENYEYLKSSFGNIKKRLGDVRYRDAIWSLENRDFTMAAKIALEYYDRAYEYGLQKRDASTVKKIQYERIDVMAIAGILKEELSCQKKSD